MVEILLDVRESDNGCWNENSWADHPLSEEELQGLKLEFNSWREDEEFSFESEFEN